MKQRSFIGLIVALAIIGGGWQQAMAAPTRLSIATAGTSGGLYAYGGAVASVVSKYVPELNVTAQATGGSVENFKLLDKKQVSIALVGGDVLHQAYHDYKNSKHFKNKVDVRFLFNMYSQPTHIITLANSNIKKVDDIKGKRIGVGSPGSGTEVKTREVLKSLGMTYKDFKPEFLSFAEAAEALQDKTIAAEFLGSSLPNSSVESLALTNGIRLISLSDSEVAKIVKDNPSLSKMIIPKGLYKGVNTDTVGTGVQAVAVCSPDLPDDVVYKLVKAVFEHKKDLNVIHPSFKETILSNAITDASVPIHPGALKYYKEKGLIKGSK